MKVKLDGQARREGRCLRVRGAFKSGTTCFRGPGKSWPGARETIELRESQGVRGHVSKGKIEGLCRILCALDNTGSRGLRSLQLVVLLQKKKSL